MLHLELWLFYSIGSEFPEQCLTKSRFGQELDLQTSAYKQAMFNSVQQGYLDLSVNAFVV